jgi:hypothetical protein
VRAEKAPSPGMAAGPFSYRAKVRRFQGAFRRRGRAPVGHLGPVKVGARWDVRASDTRFDENYLAVDEETPSPTSSASSRSSRPR